VQRFELDLLILMTLTKKSSQDDNERLTDELANLLDETAEAHHKAFAPTEGKDPDWPLWYADYLLEKLRRMLN
jgi:hypothetical protein